MWKTNKLSKTFLTSVIQSGQGFEGIMQILAKTNEVLGMVLFIRGNEELCTGLIERISFILHLSLYRAVKLTYLQDIGVALIGISLVLHHRRDIVKLITKIFVENLGSTSRGFFTWEPEWVLLSWIPISLTFRVLRRLKRLDVRLHNGEWSPAGAKIG